MRAPSSLCLVLALCSVCVSSVTCQEPGSCEAPANLRNSAFVFVKPHANTAATRSLVKGALIGAGLDVLQEIDIDGEEIDKKGLIDQHYFSIASKATILSADQIPVPAEKFEDNFGEAWTKVLEERRACNAMEACNRFGCTPEELNSEWQKAEAVKFGGGFYCARMSVHGKPELYVFNAFFMAMRSKFIGDNSIHCYVVEWDQSTLSWSSFRNEILGPTDPESAPVGSIRRMILEQYDKLGLKSKPTKGDNGVHASASPFEGLAEKANWMEMSVGADAFGRAALEAGIKQSKLETWFKDPQVRVSASERASVFDTLEELDAAACIEKLKQLDTLN